MTVLKMLNFNIQGVIKQVRKIRKFHNNGPQTNAWHPEEELKKTDNHNKIKLK